MNQKFQKTQQHFTQWWNRKGPLLGFGQGILKPSYRQTYGALGTLLQQDGIIPHLEEFHWHSEVQKYRHPGLCLFDPILLEMREYPCDTLQKISIDLGPGSLATYLGCEPVADAHTIWYTKAYESREAFPETLTFDPDNIWWKRTEALIDELLNTTGGRYAIGMPDLVENLDILASLRGTNELLYDMVDAPKWVEEKVHQINQVYFAVYQRIYDKIRLADGSSMYDAFALWGPGKTAKLQCDFSAMISPKMFRRFVTPVLQEQVEFLDDSLYHLDGTNAMQHLHELLSIDGLDAIEWTPQAGIEPGPDRRWWDLYHTILDAGKSVQIIEVQLERDVKPLLDEFGGNGVYMLSFQEKLDLKSDAITRALDDIERFR